jgi:outer membrane receptor protein involved in Fe transport
MNLSQRPGVALGATPANVIGSSPRHQANVQSSFDIAKKLQLDLIYRYVSALPAVSARAYATGDVRLAWRFSSHYELSIIGRNLASPRHIEYGADPGGPVAIRRSAFASIAWRK